MKKVIAILFLVLFSALAHSASPKILQLSIESPIHATLSDSEICAKGTIQNIGTKGIYLYKESSKLIVVFSDDTKLTFTPETQPLPPVKEDFFLLDKNKSFSVEACTNLESLNIQKAGKYRLTINYMSIWFNYSKEAYGLDIFDGIVSAKGELEVK